MYVKILNDSRLHYKLGYDDVSGITILYPLRMKIGILEQQILQKCQPLHVDKDRF